MRPLRLSARMASSRRGLPTVPSTCRLEDCIGGCGAGCDGGEFGSVPSQRMEMLPTRRRGLRSLRRRLVPSARPRGAEIVAEKTDAGDGGAVLTGSRR